jgi:hypothetical protein
VPPEILFTYDLAFLVTLSAAAIDIYAPKDDFKINNKEVHSLLDDIKRLGGLDNKLESRLIELLCVSG